MTNESFLVELQKPKVFEAFINAGLRDSSFVPEWRNEIGEPQFCSSKAYVAEVAEYVSAMVGSVIDKNAEKITHQLPVAKELSGSIQRMGDEWQLDNDKLDQFYYMEGRYRDSLRRGSVFASESQRQSITRYLYNMFENAVIAPHKRIDLLYFEGLYKGTQTISNTNNKKSKIAFTYNLDVIYDKAQTYAWGDASHSADATPIKDLLHAVGKAKEHGRRVIKIRMSQGTFYKMCQANEMKGKFEMKFTEVNSTADVVPVDAVNAYFKSIMLPPIQVDESKFVSFADGTTADLIPDDRVVLQCVPTVAVLKMADPLEAVDPIPNKTYANYDGNLVGYWRSDRGRFTDYEMWATPVFNSVNGHFILKTDETA